MSRSLGPFLEVARIQSEINRLFENLLDLGGTSRDTGAWLPNVDILEGEDHVLVQAELPGVEPGALTVSVIGGTLILEGEKIGGDAADGAVAHLEERGYGRFRRAVPLGVPVNTRQADARLADGLLRVRFPKVPNRRGEAVRIEVEAP